MIKLTPEQKYELATKFFSASWNTRVAVGLVDAVEAEVLRINGDAAAAERAACAELCRRLYDEEAADGYECQQAILARGNEPTTPRATGCPDALPESFASVGANGETLGATVQSLRRDLEQWKQNEFSRAMGCPDTMDDTARFTADELPAILRKQAP